MNKVKVFGLIVGIIGLAMVFFLLIMDLGVAFDEQHFAHWETNVFFVSAILFSVAFTLGTSSAVFYLEKKAPYFMALSTIIGAIGCYPVIQRTYSQGYDATSTILLAFFTLLPMLVSTILLAIPNKPQPPS